MKKILNKSNLQFIAAAAMLIDHISFLAPNYAVLYLMHFISRITIVIMCYFVAEGYYHTHDLNKYVLRLGIFAAISQIPFYLYKIGAVPTSLYYFIAGNYSSRNVIFTLFVGLCLLTVLKSQYKYRYKIIAVICSFFLVRNSDWSYAALLFILAFGLLHGNYKKQVSAFITALFIYVIYKHLGLTITFAKTGDIDIISLFNSVSYFGCLLALPILKMYNGERGGAPKYALYIFYPAHLLILYIVKLLLFL